MCEQCNDHAQCNCDTLDVTEILSLPELQAMKEEVAEEAEMLDYNVFKRQLRDYDIIFLSHPFKDEPKVNRKRVDYLAKEIVRDNPNTIILSPLHAFSYFENDNMREAIMEECYSMIDKADKVIAIQYDGFMSSGQSDELLYAEEAGIPIEVNDVYQLVLDKKLGIR